MDRFGGCRQAALVRNCFRGVEYLYNVPEGRRSVKSTIVLPAASFKSFIYRKLIHAVVDQIILLYSTHCQTNLVSSWAHLFLALDAPNSKHATNAT